MLRDKLLNVLAELSVLKQIMEWWFLPTRGLQLHILLNYETEKACLNFALLCARIYVCPDFHS